VLTVSALTGAGVDELWDRIVEHRRQLEASGGLTRRRARGRLAWMQVLLERRLLEQFGSRPGVADCRADLERAVEQGEITPESAVEVLVDLLQTLS
jgi:LAO/AO transport system kinase